MFKISAKLIGKSLITKGSNHHGEWELIRFIVQKQHNKVKKKIVFTAIGKVAKQINDIQLKERITVYFEPVCKQYKDKWFTELRATEVEKYVSRKRVQETMGDYSQPLYDSEFTFDKDQQLDFNQE